MFDFIPDWDEWIIIGPASENFADDEERLKKIEEDYFDDETDEDC